jgi:YVTN family beta-propeller protein
MRLRFAIICELLGSALTFTVHTGASESAFKLQNIWKLGGDGSWDYMAVDPAAHILYIARLDRIMLVDIQTGKLITEITGLMHAHGIAFDDQGKFGYISDGGAGKILVFDRASYQILAAIPAGKNPDSVLFEPTLRRLFALNGTSHDATVIDATTNSVITTIPMPGRPEFSVTDGVGNVFVNIEDTSTVLRIDAASLKTTASWSLAPGETPSGLAIDIAGHRLFSVCDNNRLIVLDSNTGKVLASPSIGEGADAVVFDPVRRLVFSSNGESGTMAVVSAAEPDSYRPLQILTTKLGARTMALDPSSGAVYTVSAALGPKPPASAANPKRRPPILPDSFVVMVYSR